MPRARGPTAILRMYMSGSDGIEPRGDAAIIEIAFVPPRATTARPSSGSSARSYSSPPAPIVEPAASCSPSSGAADHDAAADRHPLEREPRARERRVLGRLHVGAAEPAGTGERRPLGDARERLALARRPRARSALASGALATARQRRITSSITRSIVRSTFAFSTTGTLSRRARPTM